MLLQGKTSNVNKVIEKLKLIEDYREDVMRAAQQLKEQGLQQGLHKVNSWVNTVKLSLLLRICSIWGQIKILLKKLLVYLIKK